MATITVKKTLDDATIKRIKNTKILRQTIAEIVSSVDPGRVPEIDLIRLCLEKIDDAGKRKKNTEPATKAVA